MSINNYFTSQHKETKSTELKVIGNIPHSIQGKFIRNGPAKYTIGSKEVMHWFDGYGMLHGFDIKNGVVTYHSKFIQSSEYISAETKHKNKFITWGTPVDPCESVFSKFKSIFLSPSNTCVNIVNICDRFYTTSDISGANEVNITSLETVAFKEGITGTMAAHPGFASDGSVWNMSSSFGPVCENNIVTINSDFVSQKHHSFNTKKLYYAHSFAISDRYFVSIEQPMYLSFFKLMSSGPTGKSYYKCFDWDKKCTNVLHIYDRVECKMIHIATEESFFYFHIINSFEKDGKLIIDLCAYPDNSIIDDLYIQNMKGKGIGRNNHAKMARIEADIETQSTSVSRTNHIIELPNINPQYTGKQNRYTYGLSADPESRRLGDSLIKIDMLDDSKTIWCDDGVIPSEPFFISSSEGVEDDGYILSICFEEKTGNSFLIVLSAGNMTEIARAYTPSHIPSSLHGCFFPSNIE